MKVLVFIGMAGYYYWDDQQPLIQALMIANNNAIDFNEVKEWSEDEGMAGEYNHSYQEYIKNKKQ